MTEENKFSILFVDDDSFLVDMYSLKFSQAGHRVQAAQSGEEALEKLKVSGFSPDAVVFDLVMPKMDGYELLKQIKEQHLAPGAALVALSNQSERESIAKVEALGATKHIIKANAIPSEVLEMVEEAIKEVKKEA